MIENLERFKSITEGIKNVVLSLAVIIGGGWALVEFDLLHKVDRTNYELEELRQKIEQRPNIEIQIETTQSPLVGKSPEFQVLGVVHLKNTGNKATTLHFSQDSVTAAKIRHDDKGRIVYGPIIRYKLENQLVNYRYVTLLPGAGAPFDMPFVFIFKEPGLYSLLFRVEISKANATDAEAAHHVDAVSASQQVLVAVGTPPK